MHNDYKRGIQYAQDIVSGKIVSCKYIKLACQKFINEMNYQTVDYYFDRDEAQKICSFFYDVIRHVKGSMAGKPYRLSGWEIFILINVYGFRMKDNPNVKRFKNWLEFVGKKNSKSTLGSGCAIYHLLAEGEEGAEAYSVATKRDQAKICWKSAKAMISKMPTEAKSYFKTINNLITVPDLFNEYTPLGRDSDGLDGINPSFALFDEAAAIKNREIVDVITSAQASRENYLNVYITTAQSNKDTDFYQKYEYCKKILEGEIEDDTWFAAIYELDEDDEWDDESVWIKANPNLGKSVSLKFLRNLCKQAQDIPSQRTSFKIKNVNQWVNSSEAWLMSEEWSKNTIKEIDRTGPLWVGIDLGSTSDLTALTFIYRNGDKYHIETKCFIPEGALDRLPRHLSKIYSDAIESGILNLTLGNATDYGVVKEYLLNYVKDKDLKEIGYDPYSAMQLMTELLDEGLPVVAVPQGFRQLSPASKDTEVHIVKGEILHTGDPFLQWQFDNCTAYRDINDNMKIRKEEDKSPMKIDALVALIIGINRASSNGGLDKGSFFVYSG